MTRAAIVAGVILALCGTARGEGAAYVDTGRVRATATEPKRRDLEYRTDQWSRDQRLNEAAARVKELRDKGAKKADQDAALAAAQKLQTENAAALQKLAEDTDAAFTKRLTEILTKLRADRHVAITAGPGVILVPGVDLTAEVIARWDAADAKGMADRLAKAEAENARLRAAAAKPEPPKK